MLAAVMKMSGFKVFSIIEEEEIFAQVCNTLWFIFYCASGITLLGIGFAVVADEVRKLAEKTLVSTTDVANTIAAIQKSTEVNVKQVEITAQRVEDATTLTNSSEIALKGIFSIAETSADEVRAIATTSEEQSATSEEIANTIVQVNSIAKTTSLAMVAASKAVAELLAQARSLSSLIQNLKKG